MTRGRKPTAAPAIDATDALIDQDKVSGAMTQMRADAQEENVELLSLATDIGAHQAFALIQRFASAAQIQLFKRIRESKQIKHLPIRGQDGVSQTFDSIKDACPILFGRTYQSMLDAEERLDLLGEEAYETATRLRLNSATLRAARALPPAQLETVRQAIADGSSKAEVLSVIEDLATKVEEAEAATAEAQAELAAKDQVLADKNKALDKARAAAKRIQAAPPDEELKQLLQEATSYANDVIGGIRGNLRHALIALAAHGDTRGLNDVAMAGLIGQVQADLAALRQEFDLPDVSNAADQVLAGEVSQWGKKD